MTGGLIAAPTLALELARHPRGGDVAAVLLAALGLGADELADFGAMHVDSPARDRARVLAGPGPDPTRRCWPAAGRRADGGAVTASRCGDVLALVAGGSDAGGQPPGG